MDLFERIESDIKDAMRSHNALTVSIMRMAMAAIKNAEIAKKVKKLEDGDIVQVIQKMIREHNESIAQFEKGNRPDLVDKEKAELDILRKYVPAQMGEDELLSVIKSALQEAGITSKADTGKAMKAVMEKVKGRADGKIISQLVMSLLK